ncbi:hypothetical protein ACFWOG_13385 [Kitasatospora sp. NPDC058406]|uniref:hypothetical protein n=1 Tax=Kitasatospora sp. NPDC058406 TaxID=3346483 RepID=UPI0036683CA5
MGRTTRLGHSTARFAVVVLMGVALALALLGGGADSGFPERVASGHCAVGQERPAGEGGPSTPPGAPDPENCSEPSERRRDRVGVSAGVVVHRAVRTGTAAAHGDGAERRPDAGAARPRTGEGVGPVREVVLRC